MASTWSPKMSANDPCSFKNEREWPVFVWKWARMTCVRLKMSANDLCSFEDTDESPVSHLLIQWFPNVNREGANRKCELKKCDEEAQRILTHLLEEIFSSDTLIFYQKVGISCLYILSVFHQTKLSIVIIQSLITTSYVVTGVLCNWFCNI